MYIINVEDEDHTLILLYLLSLSYYHFIDTLMHVNDSLSLEDDKGCLNSKELRKSVN